MTPNSIHPIAQYDFRFALYCVWLVFITFLTTSGCLVLFDLLLHNDQVRASVQNGQLWRSAIVYGIALIWMVLQVCLAFLLPFNILKRRARIKHDAARPIPTARP